MAPCRESFDSMSPAGLLSQDGSAEERVGTGTLPGGFAFQGAALEIASREQTN